MWSRRFLTDNPRNSKLQTIEQKPYRATNANKNYTLRAHLASVAADANVDDEAGTTNRNGRRGSTDGRDLTLKRVRDEGSDCGGKEDVADRPTRPGEPRLLPPILNGRKLATQQSTRTKKIPAWNQICEKHQHAVHRLMIWTYLTLCVFGTGKGT